MSSGYNSSVLTLGALPASEIALFREFMVRHTAKTVVDVKAEVNANKFFEILMDAFKTGVFGTSPDEVGQYFKAMKIKTADYPPGRPEQRRALTGWDSYYLYFDFGSIENLLKKHLRQSGELMPLARSDIRDQLAANPYFIQIPGGHSQRFGHNATNTRCWCIDLDTHPQGYLALPDDEVLKSCEGKSLMLDEEPWVDPRKGELFLIVEALKRKKS